MSQPDKYRRRRKPVSDIVKYILKDSWPLLLAAMSKFLPAAGYQRVAIWVFCSIGIVVIAPNLWNAEKGRHFSKLLRRAVATVATFAVLGLAWGLDSGTAAEIARDQHARQQPATTVQHAESRGDNSPNIVGNEGKVNINTPDPNQPKKDQVTKKEKRQ